MGVMSVAGQSPVKRWLLPHERWFHWMETSGRMGRVDERALSRQLRTYGPDGSVLNDAAMANWSAMTPFVIANLVIGFTGCWIAIKFCIEGIGGLCFAIGLVRFVQGVRVGRRFRASRPRSRTGQQLD